MPTTIKSSNIKDNGNVDISPTASIDGSKVTGLDTSLLETNAFNIGVLGFKMRVSDGLTIFNLVDGVVDEFNDSLVLILEKTQMQAMMFTSIFIQMYLVNTQAVHI